jgi:mRNA interferase MazF
MTPRRGELWWVDLGSTAGSEIAKTRPCVVLTTNVLNERRRTVVVIPLSSSPRPHPPLLTRVQCSGRPCVAVVDQIRAVSKSRLRERIEALPPADLEILETAVKQVLELP